MCSDHGCKIYMKNKEMWINFGIQDHPERDCGKCIVAYCSE